MISKIGEYFDKRYQKRLDKMPRRQREAYERAWDWRKQARKKIKEDRKNGVPVDPLRKRMAYSHPTIILSDSDPASRLSADTTCTGCGGIGTEATGSGFCNSCNNAHRQARSAQADNDAVKKFLKIRREQKEAAEALALDDMSTSVEDDAAGLDPRHASMDPDEILFGGTAAEN